MREAWKRETYVRSQSFSSESAVKYLHVGRRKIQISPPPGEQDKSNALPQGLSLYMFHRIIFLLLLIVSSLLAILIAVPFVFSRS